MSIALHCMSTCLYLRSTDGSLWSIHVTSIQCMAIPHLWYAKECTVCITYRLEVPLMPIMIMSTTLS